MKKKAERVIRTVLFGLIFAPAWISFFPSLERITRYREPVFKMIYPEGLTFMVGVWTLAVAGLLLSLKLKDKLNVNISRLWIFWAGFVLLALVSSLVSGGSWNSLAWWVGVFTLFAFSFVVSGAAEEDVEEVLIGLFISLIVYALFIGFLLYLKEVNFQWRGWTLHVYTPPGTAAVFFVAFLFFLYRFLKKQDVFSTAGVIIFSAGAGLGGKEIFFIFIPVLVTVILQLYKNPISLRSKVPVILLSSVILSISAFYFSPWMSCGASLRSFHSDRALMKMWESQLESEQYSPMFGSPIVGSGPGLYSSGFIRHAGFDVKKLAHMLKIPLHKVRPFKLAALVGGETGVVGFVLFFAPFVLLLAKALKRRDFAMLVYPLGVILSAFFIRGSSDLRVFLITVLTAALFCAFEEKEKRFSFEGRWIVVFVVSVSIAGSVSGVLFRYIEARLRSERAIKVESYRRAGELRGLFEAWQTFPLSPDILFQFAGAIHKYEGGWSKARDLASRVLSLFPDHLPALSVIADCERRLGNTEAFLKYQERIVELNPFNNFEVIKFLRALMEMGEVGKAEQIAEKTVRINPELGNIIKRRTDLRSLIHEEY